MFASLSARVAGIGVVVLAALASLAGVLASASHQTSQSFKWVTHSAEVIETTQMALALLRAAESGQRGFIITHNPAHARSFEQQVAGAGRNIGQVVELTADNPVQHAHAGRLKALIAQRVAYLRKPLDFGRRGDFSHAVAAVISEPGNGQMEQIFEEARTFLGEERRLQASRSELAEQRLGAGKRLVVGGASAVALLSVIAFALLTKRGRLMVRTERSTTRSTGVAWRWCRAWSSAMARTVVSMWAGRMVGASVMEAERSRVEADAEGRRSPLQGSGLDALAAPCSSPGRRCCRGAGRDG